MKFKVFFLCFLLFFMLNGRAHAYLDPGTGSMVLQIIIASIVSVGCVLCAIKDRILNFLKKILNGNKK